MSIVQYFIQISIFVILPNISSKSFILNNSKIVLSAQMYQSLQNELLSLRSQRFGSRHIQSQRALSTRLPNMSSLMESPSVIKTPKLAPQLPDLQLSLQQLSDQLNEFNEEESSLVEEINSTYKLIDDITLSIKHLKNFSSRINGVSNTCDYHFSEVRLLGIALLKIKLQVSKIKQK
ncbi:Dynactin subunit p22 family protein [Spironucleus salmonicida]|uniref:Dynactin subunit p22 family protein n=1 Tax=Spironucleus salmonicida TaxID=348837 RepID=V6LJ09_9EUKA|nr:Dynactin subunit p22 family protein [Spironucleus salmonicida]|eukprot:EST44328.1 Dynactin subunit p22 family protein [Spironucleus salmonicida]